MLVNREDILRAAKLARLTFTDQEFEKITLSVNQLVEYTDMLKQLDLKHVEPMFTFDNSPRPMRPDEIQPGLTKEEALRNAPEVNLEHFSVPKTIG